MNEEECILNIVRHVNSQENDSYDSRRLKPVKPPSFKAEVLDNPFVYYLPGVLPENNSILIVSRFNFPSYIERATKIIDNTHNVLANNSAIPVLKPIVHGYHMGVSYALWREHLPISSYRVVRAIQKIWLNPRVFRWLSCLAKESKKNLSSELDISQNCKDPLEFVAGSAVLPSNINTHASQALEYLEAGNWLPFTVIQHSDFWVGNLLLINKETNSSNNEFGFYIIDWAGALLEGAPVFDLVRYCMSMGVSKKRARNEFLRYALAIEIEPRELVYYLVIALGKIGMNLEQFPEKRYVEMSAYSVAYLESLELA
jgi:hypothetical protein